MARKPKSYGPATGEDAALSKRSSSKPWLDRVDAALEREKAWRTRGSDVIKRFRDERTKRGSDSQASKINILWSNTEVLKAALYARTALPDVRRRFPDAGGGDPLARTAAEAIERSLNYCNDTYDVDSPIEDALSDYLLPGRGTIWVTYEPEIIGEGEEAYVGDQKLFEEFVYWRDFVHGKARTWARVPWVARRHALSLGEFRKKFPHIKEDPDLNYKLLNNDERRQTSASDDGEDGLVEVWECWDKGTQDRIYVARGFSEEVQRDHDPYGLREFFPCPKPLFSVMTTDQLIPEPEFCLYQDQADELDRVAGRIKVLLEALKWKGIFDGSIDGENVLATLSKAGDNIFLAYANWNVLKEKGGIENAVGFWPIERIVEVLQQLYPRGAQLIQEIYEITGISDIIRGATDPNETLGAQKLKSQFGSMRMQKRQREVQRFVRDGYRLKAEIIAEHFTQETLKAITNLQLPTREEQLAAQAEIERLTAEAEMAQPMMGHNGGPPLDEMSPLPAGAMPPPPPSLGPLAVASPQEAAMAAPPGMDGGMPPMNGAIPPGMNGAIPPPAPLGMNGGGGPPPVTSPPAAAPGGPPPPPEEMEAPTGPEIPEEVQHAATSPTWEDLIELLRNDKLRGTRIDVETDSTIFVDAEAEKQSRIEFMGAARELLTGAIEMITVAPQTIPLVKELFLFGIRSFKPGRALEEAFEDAFDQLAKNPPAPPEEPATGPDPEIENRKIDVQMEEIGKKYGLEEQKTMADVDQKKNSLQVDADDKKAKNDIEVARVELERQKVELDREKLSLEREKIRLENRRMDQEAEFKGRELDDKREIEDRRIGSEENFKKRDISLRAAAQNKLLVDEQAAAADVETDESAPDLIGLETLQKSLATMASALASAQTQQTRAIMQGFEQQGAQMADMADKLTAAKRVVRGPDNRIVGVETVQ
jgi:hypothetical protein